MTVNEIVGLDCRIEENKKIIQKVLVGIKPLSKYSGGDQVPFDKVEKLVVVISKKYKVRIKEIEIDTKSNSDGSIWKATVIIDTNVLMVKFIYGLTLYEVIAKSAIYMYQVREEVGKRTGGAV